MASYKEHCADCKRILGKDYDVVHRWLDEMSKYYSHNGMLSPEHRSYRHHREGVEEVRQKWGDEAAKAAEIHIERDFPGLKGKIPLRSDYENFQDWLWACDFMQELQ